jgi:hypothetical protein
MKDVCRKQQKIKSKSKSSLLQKTLRSGVGARIWRRSVMWDNERANIKLEFNNCFLA